MILTCPSCSASYNVPNDAIGAEGRAVRCKKCKHEWFQEGEKKALEDLINLIQKTDIDLDQLSFEEGQRKNKAKAVNSQIKFFVRLKSLLDKIVPPWLKNYLFSNDNRGFLSHFAGFMVALATFSCLILVLVMGRWGITSAFPSLTSVYEAGGFPLTSFARINPEEALTIDRVALQTEGEKREITGSLINLTSRNIKVPRFKLTYLDGKGAILKESVQHLPLEVIQREVAFHFNLTVPDDAPHDFSSVKISFTEGVE